MVPFCIWNIPLWRQLELLLIVIIFYFDHLWYSVEAGSMKYSHGLLVSALSSRSQDYGTPTNAATASSGVLGVGVDSTSPSLGTPVNSEAAAMLQSSAHSGGEVVVPKTFPLSAQEPSCEQLRAMWIFSKRQSRAAEITNEIPTYRDPFVFNVWEPYYSTVRSMGGGVRILSQYGERSRSPVFGRVINREPLIPQGVTIGYHQRHYDVDSVGSVHGAEAKSTSTYHSAGGSNSSSGSRRPSKYRYVGANGLAVNGAIGSNTSPVNVQGSFQRLKELIWTERAKELTQQRRAEELSARAAVLKEIANGQNIQSSYKHPVKSDSPLMDENRSPDRDIYQHLNDGRMSIATGQSRYIENNYSNKKNSNSNINSNNNNSSNRRKNSRSGYNNKLNYRSNGKTTKSNNKATNRNNSEHNDSYMKSSFDGPAKSSLHSYMIKTKNQNNKNFGKQKSFPFLSFDNAESSATTSHTGSSFNDEHSLDILRPYPMRTSHFRERNRAILKEDLPLEKNLETDYFSRATRLQPQVDVSSKEALLLEGIIRDLNGHTSTSVITPEYMEHFIMSKSRTEKEAAPAMFADVFALPSSLNIAFSKNTEKVSDASVIEDPIKTNAFISYAKPQVRYSAKETGGPVELYEYGTPY